MKLKIFLLILFLFISLLNLSVLVNGSDTIECPCQCDMACPNVIIDTGEITDVYAAWVGMAAVFEGSGDCTRVGALTKYWTEEQGPPGDIIAPWNIHDTCKIVGGTTGIEKFKSENYRKMGLSLDIKKSGSTISIKGSLNQAAPACPDLRIAWALNAYDAPWMQTNTCNCECRTDYQDMSMEWTGKNPGLLHDTYSASD